MREFGSIRLEGVMEDPIESPEVPDLTCREHGAVCEVTHALLHRIMELERRVRELEEKA